MFASLVTNTFWDKADTQLSLFVLSDQNATSIMKDRPPGFAVLRLGESEVNSQKKSSLILSYKLKSLVIHHTFSRVSFRVQPGKTGLKCKTEKRVAQYVQRVSDFLPELRRFITEFVSNHHFVENEVFEEDELETELSIKKFVIYPQKDSEFIVVRTKTQCASICVDWPSLTFIVERHDDENTLNCHPIKSFNEFLLDFLGISTDNKGAVKMALGYQKDLDLFTGERTGSTSTQPVFDEQLSEKYAELTPIVRPHDKKFIFDRFKELLDDFWDRKKPIPSELVLLMRSILETVKIQGVAEKMDWINRGLLPLLLGVIEKNGNQDDNNEIPIQICKHLMVTNLEVNTLFIPMCLQLIDKDKEFECVGVYSLFACLVHLEVFRRRFMKHLGLPKLMEAFVKASQITGENSIGKVDQAATIELTPRSQPVAPTIPDEEKASPLEQSNPLEPKCPPTPGKPVVPPLALPPKPGDTSASPGRNSPTYRSFNDADFKQSKSEELDTLAQKLGETYMTADLTGLLCYLENDIPSPKAKMGRHFSLRNSTQPFDQKDDDGKTLDQYVLNFRNLSVYKIKCSILETITSLTTYPECFYYARHPVNLLFVELVALMIQKNGGGGVEGLYDAHYWDVIYGVLSNFAEYVEHVHRFRWTEMTCNMGYQRKLSFRRKLDRFVWRSHQRLLSAIESIQSFPVKENDMEVQLAVLADYMRNCPTRTMCSQVVEVCMESLIWILDMIFCKGKLPPTELTENIRLINALLEVLDEIIIQNRHPPFDDVLVQLLFQRSDYFSFICHYVGQVLLSDHIERYVVGKTFLKQYRIRTIKHFGAYITLLDRQIRKVKGERKEDSNFQLQTLRGYVNELSFLIVPNKGYLTKFISSTSKTNFSLQKEVLEFLCKIFSLDGCPFVSDRVYIDGYLSLHWIQFVKLYHSFSYDDETLELCALHLRILLGFATRKNEDITMKFYQLRILDFLVRDVSLEYESTLHREAVKKSNEVSTGANKTTTASSTGNTESTSQETKGLSNSVSNNDASKGTDQIMVKPAPTKLTLPPRVIKIVESNSSAGSTPSSKEDNAKPSLPQLTSAPKIGGGKLPFIPSLNASGKMPTKAPTLPEETKTSKLKASEPEPSENRDSSSSSESSSSDSSESTDESEHNKDSGSDSPKEKSSSRENSNNGSESKSPESSEETKEGNEDTKKTKENNNNEDSKNEVTSPTTKEIKNEEDNSSDSSGSEEEESSNESSQSEEASLKPSKEIPKLKLTPALTDKKPPQDHRNEANAVQEEAEEGKEVKKGALGMIESKINPSAKLQLLLAQSQSNLQNQMSEHPGEDAQPKTANLAEQNQFIKSQRMYRKLYRSTELHVTVLELIFSLMLTPTGTLEPFYSEQFPLNAKKLNIPFLLHHHINHPANRNILPLLCERAHSMGAAEFRLMKLLCKRLFDSSQYKDLQRIGVGAYGTVYQCRLVDQHMDVAIKLMEVPKQIHSRCVLHDIFTEISILDRFRHDSRVSHLYDYGVDGDYYWIVMKKYTCSLKDWRKKQTATLSQNLSLYLNIFMNILNLMQFLTEQRVNHFDIKCDNFLIMPLIASEGDAADVKAENLWNQPNDTPNFTICLADFGESKVYNTEEDGYTLRNRGTEFNKSPEMLNVAYLSQKTKETYDRKKKVGANSATDVWALGCLLFELLTGEFLFYDNDWVRFFIRVTEQRNSNQPQQLITPEKCSMIENNQQLIEFLLYIFVRDPRYRPNLTFVTQRFKYLRRLLVLQSRLTTTISTSRDHLAVTKGIEEINQTNSQTGKPPALPKSENKRQPKKREDSAEANYFLSNCSKITDKVYLGSIVCSYNKKMLKSLDITHLVNCTTEPNPFPYYFEYLSLAFEEEDMISHLKTVIDYIKGISHGKVFVYCEDGLSYSAAIVVGYLMETNNWNYFDSCTYVMDIRYKINIPTSLMKQLTQWSWEKRKPQNSGIMMYFQCICGSSVTVLKSLFEKSETSPNPRQCRCTAKNNQCPSDSCEDFLKELKEYYGYEAEAILWGYTTKANVVLPASWSQKEPQHSKDGAWKLFRCKTCDFLTYALATKTDDIALVTNIATTTAKGNVARNVTALTLA